MIKYLFIFTLIFLFSNCSVKEISYNHGIGYLEKKQKKLIINKSNKNDIIREIGPPSTESLFDTDVWIYIERSKKKRSIFSLGKEKIVKNNVLIVELNEKGILLKKKLLNIDDINNYKFSKGETENKYSKNSFIYEFLSSVRQKVNNPAKKNK